MTGQPCIRCPLLDEKKEEKWTSGQSANFRQGVVEGRSGEVLSKAKSEYIFLVGREKGTEEREKPPNKKTPGSKSAKWKTKLRREGEGVKNAWLHAD